MKKIICIVGVIMIVLVAGSGFAQRREKSKQFKHADKNKDGVIDKQEWRMEQQWEQKQRQRRVKTWWEKRADTNGDGTVDSEELTVWKRLSKERIDLNNDGEIDAKERRLSWRHARCRVNTALEQKYDTNGDGWLESAEVKEMLRAKAALIKSQGKAKVDTEIEADYDLNNDGIIDVSEAQLMSEDSE